MADSEKKPARSWLSEADKKAMNDAIASIDGAALNEQIAEDSKELVGKLADNKKVQEAVLQKLTPEQRVAGMTPEQLEELARKLRQGS